MVTKLLNQNGQPENPAPATGGGGGGTWAAALVLGRTTGPISPEITLGQVITGENPGDPVVLVSKTGATAAAVGMVGGDSTNPASRGGANNLASGGNGANDGNTIENHGANQTSGGDIEITFGTLGEGGDVTSGKMVIETKPPVGAGEQGCISIRGPGSFVALEARPQTDFDKIGAGLFKEGFCLLDSTSGITKPTYKDAAGTYHELATAGVLLTTGPFTMPAVAANAVPGTVDIPVPTDGMAVGDAFLIGTAGQLVVTAIIDAQNATFRNYGCDGNAAPTTVIGVGQLVVSAKGWTAQITFTAAGTGTLQCPATQISGLARHGAQGGWGGAGGGGGFSGAAGAAGAGGGGRGGAGGYGCSSEWWGPLNCAVNEILTWTVGAGGAGGTGGTGGAGGNPANAGAGGGTPGPGTASAISFGTTVANNFATATPATSGTNPGGGGAGTGAASGGGGGAGSASTSKFGLRSSLGIVAGNPANGGALAGGAGGNSVAGVPNVPTIFGTAIAGTGARTGGAGGGGYPGGGAGSGGGAGGLGDGLALFGIAIVGGGGGIGGLGGVGNTSAGAAGGATGGGATCGRGGGGGAGGGGGGAAAAGFAGGNGSTGEAGSPGLLTIQWVWP